MMNEYKWKLRDDVDFEMVNKKSKRQFDFDLSDYYDKETRMFEYPKGYVAFHLMEQVFIDFLILLDLVETVEVNNG